MRAGLDTVDQIHLLLRAFGHPSPAFMEKYASPKSTTYLTQVQGAVALPLAEQHLFRTENAAFVHALVEMLAFSTSSVIKVCHLIFRP